MFIIALIIFIAVYIALIAEKFPRHWVTLTGAGLLILTGVLSPLDAFKAINWETLGLLDGMFILVSILQEAGFFSWLALSAVRSVNYFPAPLFITLVLLSAALAMFMDSITVMMFMVALTVQLCRLLKLDPVPLVIAEVCAANTGGAATLVGDPPNVILGTVLGFNFMDFASHTGPISALASLVLVVYFFLANRKALRDAHAALSPQVIDEINSLQNEPMHADLTRKGLIAFGAAVALLVIHHPLSDLIGFHIDAATCALVPAALAMIALRNNQRSSVLVRFDMENILFFTGLFMLIGGLEKVKVFEHLAETLSTAPIGHNTMVMALHWGPGLLSGVLDNVPLALAMSYMLKNLAVMPDMPALALMVWSLALGVDIGGNLTPIGASANVVAYTFMERNHGKVGWKRWLQIAAPPTLAVMTLASGLVLLKSYIGWY